MKRPAKCLAPGCPEPPVKYGLCASHNEQVRRTGDYLPV